MRRLVILSCVLSLGVALILFVNNKPDTISLTNAKAIQTSRNNLMFMVTLQIENSGDPDKLINVSSPLAQNASIMNLSGGSSAIIIPAKATGIFAMDGAHVMLKTKSDALGKRAFIPLTLTFENAGAVSVRAEITGKSMMNHGQSSGVLESPPPALSLSWKEPPDKNGATVQLVVRNFTFFRADDGAKHVPNQGHAHVYLNGLKLGRLYAETYEIGALSPGKYRLSIELNSNDHRPYLGDGQIIGAFLEFEIPKV